MRTATDKKANDGYTNVGIRADIKALLDAKRGRMPFRHFLDDVLRSAARQRGWIGREETL